MSDRTFLLTIPVERWAAEHVVPAVASEATQVASALTDVASSLDELTVHCPTFSPGPTAFEVSATLRWRQGVGAFATSLRVEVAAMDRQRQCLAEVTVRTTTRWRALTPLGSREGTAQTFTLSFGALEPISLAAKTVLTALRLVGIRAEVRPSPTLAHNRAAVLDISSQPPMSSDAASPFNPYALEGIPGDRAERWAQLGYPASKASKWENQLFDADSAAAWMTLGFSADDAGEWADADAGPDEAVAYERAGIPRQMVADAARHDLRTDDFLALQGVVPPEEMSEWMDAVREHDLLEAIDVRTLVNAGLSPWDVATTPDDLTASEIVAFHLGELEPDEGYGGDESDDLDELDEPWA